MKTPLAVLASLATCASALEVHEWGTFTVLSGSDGNQISWYQPSSDLAALPAFVGRGMVPKSGPAIVRMETPVIYFYPEKPQKVSVSAVFKNGNITETYPFSPSPISFAGQKATWSGTLHPPGDKSALALIPEVSDPDPREPYSAARNVPDAWIFRSDLENNPFKTDEPLRPQAEKFIFYRGSGQARLPLVTTISSEGEISIGNTGTESFVHGVALTVADGKAVWKELPVIPAYDAKDSSASVKSLKLSETPRPLDDVEHELAAFWTERLVTSGLCADEAAAMVATWRATWFREAGTRLLTIVPRPFVDDILPLDITPAPAKLERIFVARHELISPRNEESLVKLLNTPEEELGAAQFASFRKLELGRFSSGALQIATTIQTRRMQKNFHTLQNPKNLQSTSQRQTAAHDDL